MTQPHTIAWDALELQTWPNVVESRLVDDSNHHGVEVTELNRHLHLYLFASRLSERARDQRTSTAAAAATTPSVWACCSGGACPESAERLQLAHVHDFLQVSLPSLLDSCQHLLDTSSVVPAWTPPRGPGPVTNDSDGVDDAAKAQQLQEAVLKNSAGAALAKEQWPQLLEMLFRAGAVLHPWTHATDAQRKEFLTWIAATSVILLPALLPNLPSVWLRLIQLAIPAICSLYYRCTTMKR
jgi:hypothetical protein